MKTLLLFVLVFLLCGCQSQEAVVAADEQTPIDNTRSTVTDAEDNADEEDTVYYGQNEISPDDFVRVPYSVVEVPDSTDSETIDNSDNIEITLLALLCGKQRTAPCPMTLSRKPLWNQQLEIIERVQAICLYPQLLFYV